jgi:Zn finger protein HypA/HybF involved in hydrogenase expression
VPAVLHCRACEREWRIDFPDFRCTACGSPDVEVMSGNEFEVESIEVEEAECIAQR